MAKNSKKPKVPNSRPLVDLFLLLFKMNFRVVEILVFRPPLWPLEGTIQFSNVAVRQIGQSKFVPET